MPTDTAEGQEPEDGEGQEPEQDGEGGKPEPRTYPESYVRSLRREAAGQRNRVTELEEKLQAFADADKSDQEKMVEKLTAAERRASEAETKLLRFEVAREAGLDLDAASFLTGSTREEIEHRAEELSKLLAEKSSGNKSSAGFDGGARTPAPTKGPPEQEHNDFLMRALGRAPNR